MKAYRITSTEYIGNIPSVFIFVNGNYYGNMAYPSIHKFPQDIDYWREATCADSDRYFHVDEVEITEEQMAELEALHTRRKETQENIQDTLPWKPGFSYEEMEEWAKRNREIENNNWPYYEIASSINEKIDKIIKTL